MCGFEYPVGVIGIGDDLVLPFYLKVAGCLFQEGWAGEIVHV
jgi:hypothetical protein